MKTRLQLYEKISKSKEYPSGARQVKDGEFLEKGPALLCISAQDNSKSVFGITKYGMNIAGVHIRDNNPNGYDLRSFPVSFYAIKLEEKSEDYGKNEYETFYNEYLKNIVEENSTKKDIRDVAKKLRNLNMLVYCNGNYRVNEIIQQLKNNMKEVGYSEDEISYAVAQIGLVTLATEYDTQKIGCSVVDFHDLRDNEVGYRQIHKETVESIVRNNSTEGFFEVSDRRVEFVLDNSDEHSLKHYYRDGTATPACLKKVVSNLLESSINASNGNFIPLNNTQIMNGCEDLLLGAKKGKNRAELLKCADDTIHFDGARRLTEQESKIEDMLEEACDSIKSLRADNSGLRKRADYLEEQGKGILKSVEEMCSEPTFDKIRMNNGLWQFSKEKMQSLQNTISDKEMIQKQSETIQSQSKTIESQKKQIGDLFSKLKVVLNFADEVRKSPMGKIFFRNKIRKLPPTVSTQLDNGEDR